MFLNTVRQLLASQRNNVSLKLFRPSSSSPLQTNQPENEEHVSATLKKLKQELAEDKQALRWRTPIGDRPEDWSSKLKLFSNTEQTSDYIIMMQKPIDLSPKAIKQWWDQRQERTERFMQQFIPDRHRILGPDLAAAHFILYRGGAVKFIKDNCWHRANEDGEFNLPNKYDPSYKVEALRCDHMLLYYEGLENLRELEHLKFLSFYNIKSFDNWCLDRVSGSLYPRLEVLDVSGTSINAHGLSCLYRINTLKLLIVDDPKKSIEFELACAMLELSMPKLKIVDTKAVHNDEVDIL